MLTPAPPSSLPPFTPDTGHSFDVRLRIWLEATEGQILAFPNSYPAGYTISRHSHSRSQLLYVASGSIMIVTTEGRWLIPAHYALWIPAGIEHSVVIFSHCEMKSVFISPNAVSGLAGNVRVLGLTTLALSLIHEVMLFPDNVPSAPREYLLLELLIHEVPRLPEQPLSLPFPSDPGLAALCRRFLEAPSIHTAIDDWAVDLAVSRRTFTRFFVRETGISFSAWRQQACLLAAIPRLGNGESIMTVALDLGYKSAAAFTVMFKRVLGISLRSYLAVKSAP